MCEVLENANKKTYNKENSILKEKCDKSINEISKFF